MSMIKAYSGQIGYSQMKEYLLTLFSVIISQFQPRKKETQFSV